MVIIGAMVGIAGLTQLGVAHFAAFVPFTILTWGPTQQVKATSIF